MSWLDQEARGRRLTHELVRIWVRARVAWKLVVVVAALLTAGVLVHKRFEAPIFRGRILLRIDEGEIVRMRQPPMPPRLAEYLENTALSNDALAKVSDRLGMFADDRGRRYQDRLDQFREQFGLVVWDNYFADSRGYSKASRTAATLINYDSTDRDQVMPVLRAIVQYMRETDAVRRVEAMHVEALVARAAILSATDTYVKAQEYAARAIILFNWAARVGLAYELAEARVLYERLERQALAAGTLVGQFRVRKEAVDTRYDLAATGRAVNFRVVDEREPYQVNRINWRNFGGMVFVAALVGVAMFVGAFDPRIHCRQDLEREGLRCLAEIPENCRASAEPGERG